MISYKPFWETLKTKKMSKYKLIYYHHISSNTLRRMSHNEPITTNTIDLFCEILHCDISDIIEYVPKDNSNDSI